jgi:hypothetical protein
VEDHGRRVFVTEDDAPGTVVVMELPVPRPGLGAQDAGVVTRDSGLGVRD